MLVGRCRRFVVLLRVVVVLLLLLLLLLLLRGRMVVVMLRLLRLRMMVLVLGLMVVVVVVVGAVAIQQLFAVNGRRVGRGRRRDAGGGGGGQRRHQQSGQDRSHLWGFFFIKLSFLSFLWRMTWSRRGKKSSFSFLCQKKLIKKKSKEHVRYDASRRKFRMTSHSTGSCPIHVSKLDRKELQVAICNEKPPKKNKKQKKAVLTLDIRRTFPDFVSTGKSFFF